MKQIVFYAVATSLLLGAGCKKGEDKPAEPVQKEEVVATTQPAPAQTTVQPVEAPALTSTAPTPPSDLKTTLAETTESAVGALTVKAEDVMAELNQSVDEIKQKVAGLDAAQLLAYTDQYKAVIAEKKEEIAALKEQVTGLSMTELMGDAGKALKSQISQYSNELAGLTDRYAVYLDALKQTGTEPAE